jgi:hypothetical protein
MNDYKPDDDLEITTDKSGEKESMGIRKYYPGRKVENEET